MAAGPATRVSDVIVPEVFTPYMQTLTEEKSRLVQSGLLSRSEALDNLLAGGGLTFQVPSFRDLDNDADRISTDTSVPFADADASLPAGVARPPDPLKIATQKEIAVRLNRNNSWSSTDLAAILAGADPMEAIANRVAAYWTRRLQAAFIATWNGVIADNAANDSGDYINDISGAGFTDGVTNFSAEAFLDAAQTMGDSQEDLVACAVHSVVYNRMQKNNLIDFIPDARGEINIPTFLGREVIVDDGLPRTGSVYDTWLFGAGATAWVSVLLRSQPRLIVSPVAAMVAVRTSCTRASCGPCTRRVTPGPALPVTVDRRTLVRPATTSTRPQAGTACTPSGSRSSSLASSPAKRKPVGAASVAPSATLIWRNSHDCSYAPPSPPRFGWSRSGTSRSHEGRSCFGPHSWIETRVCFHC